MTEKVKKKFPAKRELKMIYINNDVLLTQLSK